MPTDTHSHINFVPNPQFRRTLVVLTKCETQQQLRRIYPVYIYIKTETNKLQIMKISLNPKPHLEKKRLPLVWAPPCQQCSMGNEEWVGVWPDDLSTSRLGPSRTPSTSPCAQLQLDRSPSFSHIQKEVARRVWTGGGGEETASQMVVVFLEHSTVYSPSGLIISFTW